MSWLQVFTPPQLVNRMLDLLPAQLWSDPKATFLDPGCKSGVFPREIAKRLDVGLEQQISDRQQRVNQAHQRLAVLLLQGHALIIDFTGFQFVQNAIKREVKTVGGINRIENCCTAVAHMDLMWLFCYKDSRMLVTHDDNPKRVVKKYRDRLIAGISVGIFLANLQ